MELSSVTAGDEVDQGRLKDPGRKKGQRLLPEAGGPRQDPTQKTGWCAQLGDASLYANSISVCIRNGQGNAEPSQPSLLFFNRFLNHLRVFRRKKSRVG